MLSLDPLKSQYQIDQLDNFCNEWGIEINELKTKVMIIGKNKFYPTITNLTFKTNRRLLKIVESYCYLGIILHKSGELQTAQTTLKTKAGRAFYGLKRNIIRSKLSFKALNTLFDSLIKPILYIQSYPNEICK